MNRYRVSKKQSTKYLPAEIVVTMSEKEASHLIHRLAIAVSVLEHVGHSVVSNELLAVHDDLLVALTSEPGD